MRNSRFLNSLSILLTGIALGWLVGLSVSHVVQTVVASLIGLLVSIISILAGLHSTEDDSASKNHIVYSLSQISVFPIMFLVIGISTGTTFGILARTHSILSPKEYRERFVNNQTKKNDIKSEESTYYDESGTVLFGSKNNVCRKLCGLDNRELILAIKSSSILKIRDLLKFEDDSVKMRNQLNNICKCND